MSESHIDKGAKWSPEIAAQLEQAQIGIICLTQDNLTDSWINFEAGALSKLKDSRVCTFLLDLSPAQVPFPLAQFQHTHYDKEDIQRLLDSINKKLPEPLSSEQLTIGFEMWWKKLDEQLTKIPKASPATSQPTRKPEDMLEELITSVRTLSRGQSTVLEQLREILGENPMLTKSFIDTAGAGAASGRATTRTFGFRENRNPLMERNVALYDTADGGISHPISPPPGKEGEEAK
jgi:hypothetical protein